MRPEPPPDVLDYLRANRATYTREAIDRELREAGHSEEAIEAAWRAFPVEGAAEQLPTRSVIATAQFWVLLVVVACGAIFLLPIVGLFALRVFAWLTAALGLSGNNGLVLILVTLVPIVVGYLGVGYGAWRLRRRDLPTAYGMLGGLVAGFVFSVIVVGSCVAILAQL